MSSEHLNEWSSQGVDVHPLSSPQWDIYQDQLMKAGAPTYNIGGYLDFLGALDVEQFEKALQLLIDKHDALRIMLVDKGDDVPGQYIVQALPHSLPFFDFSARANPHADARAWMHETINMPFALIGQPLFRCALIQLSEHRFHWFICAHHLIADGWSMDTIFQSFAELYSALKRDEAPNLTAPSYIRFIESDKSYLTSRQFDQDKNYWLEKYRDTPDPLLSSRHQDQLIESATASGEYSWQLSTDLDSAISALADAHASTRFQIMLGIFYAFFLRLEQRDAVTIGLSVLNRKDADFRKTAGLCSNVLPMTLQFDANASFLELLKVIATTLRRDYRHQHFPIGELNKGLGLFKSHRSQLYDLSISYENGGAPLVFGDTPARSVKCTNDHESTPLRLCIREDLHSQATTLYFIFTRSYFNDDEIKTLQDRFTCFATALLSHPDSPLVSLSTVTAAEIEQFAAWNATEAAYPDDVCIHELFQRQTEQTPDAIAAIHGNESLTYAALNAAANRLAHQLIACGVRPDQRVALCVARGQAMLVGMLAILKAGGAYVPLDPTHSSERLTYALQDAQAGLLLIDSAGRSAMGSLPTSLSTLDLDSTSPAWATLSARNPRIESLRADHLAYVIYTSGSTGQPKGVMVEHRNVCHQVFALQQAYRLRADDRMLQFASMAFDMSVEEIFPALLSGATLVMRTDEWLSSASRFVALCAEHQLTSLNLPAPFWAQLALAQPELELPRTLRRVSVGGDAMSLPATAAWLSRSGHRPELFNAYGPTEATVNASLLQVEQTLDVSSIGRPVSNTQIYLLDAHRQPLPIGAVGELYIGGAGVARGYLNQAELSAERFLPDPFSGHPDARMYRSGDLARYLPDGQIEFLGRNDNQVKVRGFRIELGEIETRLASHPAVREAIVLALGEGHDKRLVAYLVAQTDAGNDLTLVGEWRRYLAAGLPDYMVPAAFVRLEAFPLTVNGKIDRKALPVPDDQAFASQPYAAPVGEVEIALAALWSELLGVERIGRHDHFFELGGHSLIAIRLLGRVGQLFDVALPLVSLFNQPTLADLANTIDTSRKRDRHAGLPPIQRVSREQTLPLSYAQQRLWFMAQLDNTNATYHVSLVLRLEGALDTRALRRGLDRLLSRHEALRTVFRSADGAPYAVLLSEQTPFPFVEYDLRDARDSDRLLRDHLHNYAHAPFELEHGPLIRAGLIRLAEQRYTLLISMHHIVADGWSMHLLAQEISALYVAFSRQQADPLSPLAIQYPDYASWQRAALGTAHLQRQVEYWRQTLDGAPELLHLPTDRPRPPRQSFDGAVVPIHIDASLTQRLKHFCRRHSASLFMLLTTAWASVLSRLSGQDDVLIGTLSANRGQREIEQLIGFFVSTLALRLDLSGEPNAAELLARVRQTILAAQENQDLPFEQVVEIARPSRRLDHSPLFQVLFAWQSNDRSRFDLPGITVSQADMSLDSIRYDLELHLYEKDDAIVGGLGYSTALFDPLTIERHRGYLITMLEAMLSSPQQPIERVPLPGPDELAQLAQWNRTDAAYPQDDGIHRLFEQHVARSPHAIALIYGEQQLSYAELNSRANRCAHHLRALGIGTHGRVDQRIALCAGRGFGMVIGLLAILKAGACYVPLDPSYPSDRLQQILAEARADLVLSDAEGRAALDVQSLEPQRLLDLDALPTLCGALPPHDLASSPDSSADRLAYVIYTSGSTGTPKGVAMPHRPLINLIHWQATETVRTGVPAPRTLQFAALGFDVAFQEIFSSLAVGAALVLIDAQTRLQFDALIERVRRERVQRMFLPYIALQTLADTAEPLTQPAEGLLPDLRDIIVAGEQLRLTPQIQRFFKRVPDCWLHNHYGPTETHAATAETLTPAAIADAPSHVPIGRPIANARIYLLDRYGELVPQGVAGELHIGGAGVARGYLDRTALTAERFVRDPFDTRPDARMYRTGDLARYLSDGRLLFLGRNDHQVKIRGFRIELGEIEARIAEHPRVRECAVLARNQTQGDAQLIAYVVPLSGFDDVPATLHAYLSNALPGYMVPAAFVVLDALPLTAHGKLDRNALPAPSDLAFARARYEPPQGDTETELARLWQNLLGVAQVGRHDHFFELGGHSLIAVRLLSHISRMLGIEVPLATLFAQPVLRDLAKAVTDKEVENGANHYVAILPAPRDAKLPLSHAQQRLWFLAQLDEANATYHIPLAVRLDGALDVAALRRALKSLFVRHESLRTIFVAEQGQVHAELLSDSTDMAWRERDLRGHYDADATLTQFLAQERNRPFDLTSGPLIRVGLARIKDDSYVLQLTLHHIIADGWSLGILARELGVYYAAAQRSPADSLSPPAIEALPIQYADYVAWEHTWLTRERLSAQTAYWRDRLADAPTLLALPTDRPRPERQSFTGTFVPLTLDRTLTQQLKQLSQRHGVTLFMLVLAAWAVVLSRLANQKEVVIGTPTAGRGRHELESLIGFFVNTLALRIDLGAASDTASLLAQVRQIALDAQANQQLPFEQVVDSARVTRRMDRTPLVQVLFAWQNHDEVKLELPGMAVEPILGEFDWVKFDLELILGEADDIICGGLSYASALFDHATIERQVAYLQTMLEAMVADHARPLNQISMLDAAEQQLLLQQWNQTAAPYPHALCMHQLVERWAQESPSAIALVSSEGTLSYAELNARANRLAHYLIERGVRPDRRVALCGEKGLALFVGLLGILKAGGAYVPLDPAYASIRLDHILRDAAPTLLLCDESGRAAIDPALLATTAIVDLGDSRVWADRSACDPHVATLNARHLAYVIYTSGSTGTPKGVMVEHRGVLNLALSLSDRLGVDATSRVSQFASIGFDASVFESAMTFAVGGALYLPAPTERETPAAFIAFVRHHRITHATVPPAFLQGHIEPPQWSHRPTLLFAGDALGPGLITTWMPYAKIANAYGPTEISVCANIWLDADVEVDIVPVGRPLANTRIYLLDEHELPVPRGSIGELYIGGVGVARGYLNRAELTAERFVPDPFDQRPGARMYRSGDLMRYSPQGELIFMGRNDQQIKLRGFRIELGEIEAQLATHSAVRENVVLAREDRPGVLRLVAYVVAETASTDLVVTLRDYLSKRLPDYMIPTAFVVLEKLPLTAHGKLDRKALPAPDDLALAHRDYEPPRGATEIALAALWAELLGIAKIGRHDHFFELGGHSLVVAQLAARVRERFETDTTIRDIFRYPVLKDMAELVTDTDSVAPDTFDLSAELVLDDSIRATATAVHGAQPKHILLTGASGFLGAFLLQSLLKHTHATVHCLIRCTDAAEGQLRLDTNMCRLGLADYDRARVSVIMGDLTRPLLGLNEDRFNRLANLIEVIYHNGAWVNSLHTYASLKAANVAGTQEVLRLASLGAPKHIHYISTLSTIPPVDSAAPDITTEAQLAEDWRGLPSGYAQSKWVAERLLRIGGERGIPYTIYRPTHIAASSSNGASNASDTWSLFVDACLLLERVPEADAPINSLPVDYVSDCIVSLSLQPHMQGRWLNLAHPQSFMLSELIRQIAAIDALDIEYIDYRHWRQLCSEHPATRRLASVMPAELPTRSVTAAPTRIELSNVIMELSREETPYPSIGPELLRKFVAWRFWQCTQLA